MLVDMRKLDCIPIGEAAARVVTELAARMRDGAAMVGRPELPVRREETSGGNHGVLSASAFARRLLTGPGLRIPPFFK